MSKTTTPNFSFSLSLKDSYIKLSSMTRLHSCPIPLIGLTGGIASGKSSASRILKSRNLPLLCADELVKKVYQDEKTLLFLKDHFPSSLSGGQQINFKYLREIVFSDPQKKKMVEDFIYPQLPLVFHAELAKLGSISFLVYDVPLLFEKSLQGKFDLILCIAASEHLQIQRLVKRDGISRELAQKMLAAQLPMKEKQDQADFLIENEGTLEELEKKLDDFLRTVLNFT